MIWNMLRSNGTMAEGPSRKHNIIVGTYRAARSSSAGRGHNRLTRHWCGSKLDRQTCVRSGGGEGVE